MTYPSLCWEDISEGEALPGFSYELGPLRLVAHLRATGLYDPTHFDPDYARRVGAADAFISTSHLSGLYSRLITDWSGPRGAIRQLTVALGAQMLRGDMLVLSGKVARKYRGENGEFRVELGDLNVATASAQSASRGSAIVELPSRSGASPAPAIARPGESTARRHPDMPEFAVRLAGEVQEGKPQPEQPLTSQELHLWCEALEDWNPLYWDADYAAQSAYGGLVAPPFAMFLGVGSSLDVGLGYRKPGAKVPDAVSSGLTGMDLLAALRSNTTRKGLPFEIPGCPEVVVTQARFDLYTPLRVGDTLRSELRLVDCSPRRKTRLGEGYFVTIEDAHSNQRSELVKTVTMTLFYYQP